jgi:hypothetical protein
MEEQPMASHTLFLPASFPQDVLPQQSDAAADLLNPDQVFSTTVQLTAWITAVELYVDAYLETHGRTGKGVRPVADTGFRSSSCESGRFQERSRP